jgi:FKBP-type peptidyl-prolyl cis-trans isomerase
VRRIATALLPLLLVVTACGGEAASSGEPKVPKGTLSDIKVVGPPTARPKVDFKPPLSFATTSGKILDRGSGKGEAVSPSSRVTVDYVAINASDGVVFDSSWKRGKPATFNLSDVIPGFAKGLQGAHAGDRVLMAVAPKDGDPEGNGTTIRKGDSLIFVVDVEAVMAPLTRAQLPQLVTDNKGQPKKFVATAKTARDVAQLSVVVLKAGTGAPVEAGQTITVEYLGQVYPDGKIFDESYSDPKPRTFQIGTGAVIPAWDQGLVGQKVGSRVLLAVPSELAYGTTGKPPTIPPNADLIFVVDILKAS